MLKKISILNISSNDNPKFIKNHIVTAKRENESEPIKWEMIESHDAVHIVVYDISSDEFLLVKQVRIPVLINDAPTRGEVYEACAGIIDKECSTKQIAKEEILEELGYDVDLKDIHFIRTLKSAVGISGRESHTFYAEVTSKDKVSEGGGIESEDIEVIRIPLDKIYDWMYSSETITDAITLFLINYYLDKKKGLIPIS
jgi:UDP-sugar diphosphatase